MVGRDDEVSQAWASLDDASEFQGVLFVGDSGVGKSTLARALADTAASRGLTVRFVLGTESGRAVPLGAFYWLVTLDTAREPAAMLAAAHKTLEREENLVVIVDDAHLLDPLSASLVYHLAARGSARLIVTIRSGNAVPDAVTALWKEGLLLDLHIDPFTWQQTEELARAVLGDAVETRLVNELHGRTAGNPLMLRGLLNAGRERRCAGAHGSRLAASRCAAWRPPTLRSSRVSPAILGRRGIGGGRGCGRCRGPGLGDHAWTLRC